jgi:TonB family protein
VKSTPDNAAKTTHATAPGASDPKAPGAPERALPIGVAHAGAEAVAPKPGTNQSQDDAAKADPKLTMPAAMADAKVEAVAGAKASLFGGLDADERIRQSSQQGERTLWAGAVVATLVYIALIGGQMVTGFAAPIPLEQQQKERRGQDGPDSISVEIVPDPDKTSKTTRWREGAQQQSPTPSEQPPTPEQMASMAQPEVPELQQEEQETKEEEAKKTGEPADNERMLLDIESLVDAAAADFKRNLDHALAKRPKRQQQAMMSSGGMQVRGKGASGRSDVFTNSVIAALMKTRPGPFALWGRVLVSFEISPSGTLNYVHVLHSSGNSALDQAAVDAIHKAQFKAPPPGLTRDERTYIIDYIFG